MTLTKAEAQQALDDIRRTEFRGKTVHSYHASSRALMLWGAIWVAAYTATGLLPGNEWWVAWVPANLVGAAGTALLYRRSPRMKSGPPPIWIVLAAVAFLSSLYVVAPPHSAAQAEAMPALLVALLYVVLGAGMKRFALIGAVVFAATLGGFLWLPGVFAFWMAAVGGGALIAGGLWLRSA